MNADCGKGIWNELGCLKISPFKADTKWSYDKYGVLRKCNSNKVVIGICGSGYRADCRTDDFRMAMDYQTWIHSYTASRCAKMDNLDVDHSKKITIRGDHGQRITCPEGYVVVSVCGSGRDADCSGRHTQMECAPLKLK